MKYAVTYCTFDQTAGANPFWHTCILLSRWDGQGPVEIVDNWGFYGVPSTSGNGWLSRIKTGIGLDIDLQGNHGILRHEEARFMDKGQGLHGITFELTEEKFDLLQQKCLKIAREQEDAIREVVQGIPGKPADQTRVYPHEGLSHHIYNIERAKKSNRLSPFDIQIDWTLFGPSLKRSHTCKSQILSLLQGIIPDDQIDRLTENGKHPTVPRYSGKMEDIYLYSEGPMRKHIKSSGEEVLYRDLNDEGVAMFWAVPPQLVVPLSDDTTEQLKISEEYCPDVKKAVAKLLKLEWLFYNADIPNKYEPYRRDLIQRIHDCYDCFARIEPKQPSPTIGGFQGYCYSLLNQPRNRDEKILLEKLARARWLFNALYMAAVDGWTIRDHIPSETQIREKSPVVNPYKEEEEIPDYNPLEALASCLTDEDRKKLCAILGRTYIEPEEVCQQSLEQSCEGGEHTPALAC
ncbi:hypothetical protein [Legionella spiritensis]|uniref:hypothetical protein n=1 Tax=Legionella spiritensis TaxID=452 RepID=UPI000F6E0F12|nr:hypothetical protein [Legionella spiritensis]VEG90851.1 Uncharacterised protein [Legionella spiritensis]